MTKPKTTVKKKKKTGKRKMTPILKLGCYVLIAVSCFFLVEVGKEIITTITLQKQLSDAKVKYEQVVADNNYLTMEKQKLEDPNYVQSYARGNYMLSKDGEQIFYLPEKDDK